MLNETSKLNLFNPTNELDTGAYAWNEKAKTAVKSAPWMPPPTPNNHFSLHLVCAYYYYCIAIMFCATLKGQCYQFFLFCSSLLYTLYKQV